MVLIHLAPPETMNVGQDDPLKQQVQNVWPTQSGVKHVSVRVQILLLWALTSVIVAGVLALHIVPANAQSLPVPNLTSKPRAGTQTAASETKPTPPAPLRNSPGPAQPDSSTPFLPDLRKLFTPGSNVTFDTNQKIIANKVSAYLSSLQNVTGNFVQIGPDGSKTTGDFYIQKPGKVRFEYDDPSPIAIVADGTTVVVRDRRLATQDNYPLSQTPLRFLLSDRIDLLRDTNLVNVSSDDVYASVTIEEKQPLIGTSRLMLMVGAKDNQLKQWTVTDPQGYDTTIAVYNLNTTKKLDPAMFKIDFTNFQNSPN